MTDRRDIEAILREAFAEEVAELLAELRADTLELEHAAAPRDAELHRSLHRNLHTMKGSAGAMGLSDLAHLCHSLEDMLDGTESQGIMSVAAFDLLARCWDAVESMAAGQAGLDHDLLAEVAGELSAPEVEPGGQGDEPGAEPGRLLAEPTTAIDAAEPDAGPTAAADESVSGPPTRAAATRPAGDEDHAGRVLETAPLRVRPEKVDALQSSVGDLVVAQLQVQSTASALAGARDHTQLLTQAWHQLRGQLRGGGVNDGGARRYTLERAVADITRSLAELQGELFSLSGDALRQSNQLGVVASALDDEVHRIRMQPVKPFFESLAPALRQAARLEGRQVRLESDGAGLEADRATLARLRDGLAHLLRNAVAHGIEDTAERVAAGKAPVGTVTLEARQEGQNIVLSVADDGAGIDREGVADRALQAGLIAAGQELDDEELLRVLTAVGFSTRDDVDVLAGRGIGMDVVADAVDALRGQTRLKTVRGQGTRFEISVPARLTSATGLVAHVGDHTVGIPIHDVERLLRISSDAVEQVEGAWAIELAGEPVTLCSLASLLGAPELTPPWRAEQTIVVVLKTARQRVALLVDDVSETLPLVVRPLGPQFDRLTHLSGCALLPTGDLLPVIDPRGLMALVPGRGALPEIDPVIRRGRGDTGTQTTRRTVLVVEDSLTMRSLQRNILEAAGHRVLTAVDGREALDMLAGGGGYDLVITDLDMPRMGGIELCGRLRGGAYGAKPIMIVTSHSADSERMRGVQAGADAWITKADFDQGRFLSTVARLLA